MSQPACMQWHQSHGSSNCTDAVGVLVVQELSWCMKELAQLQKEKNDWRCNSWLEQATGRSTVLAATPGQLSSPQCLGQCLSNVSHH